MESCQRSYGSEGSLNQHVKIKHAEVYYAMHPDESESEEVWQGVESEVKSVSVSVKKRQRKQRRRH